MLVFQCGGVVKEQNLSLYCLSRRLSLSPSLSLCLQVCDIAIGVVVIRSLKSTVVYVYAIDSTVQNTELTDWDSYDSVILTPHCIPLFILYGYFGYILRSV